jgi:hypothetical protein
LARSQRTMDNLSRRRSIRDSLTTEPQRIHMNLMTVLRPHRHARSAFNFTVDATQHVQEGVADE